MNKTKRMLAPVVFSAVFWTSCERETLIPMADIPVEISDFAAQHFMDHTILQCIKEVDDLTVTYDVLLSEMVELEFNRKKESIKVHAQTAIPGAVIPDVPEEYALTHYPTDTIIGWEKDDRRQVLSLMSGLELEFDLKGELLRIDL